jgi:hypothetical protein
LLLVTHEVPQNYILVDLQLFRWATNQLMVIKLAKSPLSGLLDWVSSTQALVNHRLMLHDRTLPTTINIHLIEWFLPSDALV